MRFMQQTIRRQILALICVLLVSAVSAEAKKPPKPDPEPKPEGPAYWIVAVEGGINPESISDTGTLVGSAWFDYDGGGFQTPAALPAMVIDGIPEYPASGLYLLPDVDGEQEYGDCIAMNAAGIAVGYVYDPTPEEAILWLPDGAAVDLGVDPDVLGGMALAINDAGLVLVGVGREDDPGDTGGVVVPLDGNNDGEPDTWFVDDNGDGINDLFFITDIGHILLPLAINEAGQELAAQIAGGDPVAGYLVTPDFTDADDDGNAWFADGDNDGFNDLLVPLEPPVPGDTVVVADLNNFGQVAGNSGGHAVRWEFVDGVQIVTDLGSVSDKAVMTATGIDDSGRMVGTSRIPTGRRSKDGPSWMIEDDVIYELLPLMVNGEGWSDLEAEGVNRHGWILGDGVLDDIRRTFVAVPVEEP